MTSPSNSAATSLYIHIPFCQRKCLYCSFVVYVSRQKNIDTYLTALAQEASRYPRTPLRTIYCGGGTPSLLSVPQWETLWQALAGTFDLSGLAEFTVELNPEDVDIVKARWLAEKGVTRVSLGVQSFQEKYLKALGRCHSVAKARQAFDDLRAAGFRNINVDLIFGFPGQTRSELEEDLATVTEQGSEHVSIYSLSVEPHSRFFSQQVKPADDERQLEFYRVICLQLESSGLLQYEVSNFSQPGKESIHNLNYWQSGNYIGLGVAAHSHLNGRRSWNVTGLAEYGNRLAAGSSPEQGFEELSALQRLQEALVFGLRMNDGVSIPALEQRFNAGLPLAQQQKIQDFISAGFLRQRGALLQATTRGRQVLDELAAYLV